MRRTPHAVTIPRRLQRFLSEHENPEISVHAWALTSRVPADGLPPSLRDLKQLPEDGEFGVSDFATAIQLTRSARLHGAAHTIVEDGGETFHLSAVPTIDRSHLIFLKHPDGGLGEVELMDEAALIFHGTCDDQMRILSIDEDLIEELGIATADEQRVRLASLVDDESFDDLVDCWVELNSAGVSSCSVQFRHRSGEVHHWYHMTLFRREDEIEFIMVNTADNLRARRAQEARSRFRNISETVPHGIFRISETGHVIYTNSKVREIFGDIQHVDFETLMTTDGISLSSALPSMLEQTEEAQFEVSVPSKDGERFLRVRARVIASAQGGSEFVGSVEDVTVEVERSNQLELEALTDPMTGAANRRALETKLSELLDDQVVESFAVMLCDLDGFKQVNDSLGHGAGDQVIADFGARLLAACRRVDLVARLGGDEFVVIVRDARDYEAAMAFADRLLPVMREPFRIGETTIELSGSIGVAIAEPDSSVLGILQMADHAMYEAKRAGRNQASPYHTPDAANPVSPLALRRDLRRAIGADELDLAFQPIFAIDDLIEPEAAEALLRWDHPTLGAVDPATMISIAEQSGLIGELGDWILNEAVCAAAQINNERSEGQAAVSINVNVSALQIGRPDFAESVAMALDVHELDAELLTVELTESYLIDQLSDGRKALDEITAMGVRLAIDDFGTGFSTFEYLITMPVYSVKIDPSFTRRLADPRGRAMLSGLGKACRELDMLVIVEGVETPEQLLAARDAGATHAQGYLLGMPIRSRNLDAETVEADNRAA